jgi:hypothetical protein
VGPVILIHKFNVKPEDVDQLLKGWAAEATYFKQQPGFISTQLGPWYWWQLGICYLCILEYTPHFKNAAA